MPSWYGMPEPRKKGSTFRWSEVSSLARLAGPVALGELGWMAMSTVDLIMAGALGAAAIGAIGVGNSVFYTFGIMGIGLLLGLDTLVSQAYGAGNFQDCRHSLVQGLWLAAFISVPLTGLFWLMRPIFELLHVDAEVSRLAASYLAVLSLSMPPLAYYAALRRYLQGIGRVRPIMFALISANFINWFFNWLLITGHWGFPALGVSGSALSTVIARVYMAVVLTVAVWTLERSHPHRESLRKRPDWARLRVLLRIGFPAAMQILLEIGAFGMVGLLAGQLSQTALAAHQIALNCAAFTFMVPFGIASAAAVSVGHAVGRGDRAAARRAGYIALALGCLFMTCTGLIFLLAPGPMLRLYTTDIDTIAIGTGLLAVAAAFQLFDGAQVVLTGALRGLADTRAAMLANLLGYWAIGLPVGYVLCFYYRFGVFGLWWGLTLSLVLISAGLCAKWNRVSAVTPLVEANVLAAE
jgi:MATE family multidrug resistance protein